MPTPAADCLVCKTLPPKELIELDLILSDPLRWPDTIWGMFAPPEGGLPASYRRFGAMQMGMAYFAEKGYTIAKSKLRHHLTYDVPVLNTDVSELVSRGLVASLPADHSRTALATPIDPLNYVRFYNKGIELGIQGLDLLTKRIQELIDHGDDIPLPLIKMMVEAGSKLAMSQASIRAAGRQFGGSDEEENESFRGADDIGAKFGEVRVRVIDGEQRPIVDRGHKDRQHYNERAAQEAMPPIGGR